MGHTDAAGKEVVKLYRYLKVQKKTNKQTKCENSMSSGFRCRNRLHAYKNTYIPAGPSNATVSRQFVYFTSEPPKQLQSWKWRKVVILCCNKES